MRHWYAEQPPRRPRKLEVSSIGTTIAEDLVQPSSPLSPWPDGLGRLPFEVEPAS